MNIFDNMFDINNSSKNISGLNRELQAIYIYNRFIKKNQSIIFLVNSLYEATQYYDDIKNYTADVFLFPMDDFLTSEALAISPELKITRLETINKILKNKKIILITHLMGYLRYLPPKNVYINNLIILEKNKEYSIDKIKNKIINIGYEKESIVNKTGETAFRGFVIDVFSINYDNPIRIEFFGDTIESIRFFDVNSQKTIKEINEITIDPQSEFLLNEYENIEDKSQKNLKNFTNVVSINDYINSKELIIKDYNNLCTSYTLLKETIKNYNLDMGTNCNYMHDLNLDIDNFIDIKDDKINPTYISKEIPYFSQKKELINQLLNEHLKNKKIIVVCLPSRYLINKFIENLENHLITITSLDNIFKGRINVIIKKINNGFEFNNYVVVSEREIFGRKDNYHNYDSKFKIGTAVKDITKINFGDYIVHMNYGIGRYCGITQLIKKGLKKDYILLEYKNKDKLYIPVEKLELLKKYSSNETIVPSLSKLGSGEWEKTKAKLKSRVNNIANELLNLYAARESNKGFAFLKDSEEQKEFENQFKYKETSDQIKVIKEIKGDMEKEVPMDRLLCGDVGFGKTEVAFRAMFKAVLSGKQVALLCPTTILSFQHYHNAIDRFRNFPINIEVINRFINKRKTGEILKKIKENKIDIVIGTHRILSDDVVFKDLGLLVIDEEQRFGVVHKEKIKKYRNNIDVLTLSATPIPRTMQMTLAGIRSLSLIETPPNNRYPIQTYVVAYNKQLIKEAIYKEKSRNGQVFILHNKIEDMNLLESEIKILVPDSRVTFAHGKMSKNELENIMLDFTNYKYDVLICTTIIETGIDIPRVNTLIILEANNFGLSQLYQIRGRVGRSDKIAYCYLMYEGGKVLTEIAKKRLNVIKEFTKLGSGFSIAMRDLSIRGAGDILGPEQAGYIDTVGIELFLNMLENEIKHIKGIEVIENVETDELMPLLDVDTSISDSYVKEEEIKVEIHTKINTIDSYERLIEVKTEIEDRFGRIDDKLLIYMHQEWFEKLASKLKITNVKQTKNSIEILLPKLIMEKINVQELFAELNKITRMFRFTLRLNKIVVVLDTVKLEKHFIYYMIELLKKIEKQISK